jgi:hypothetical protein
MELVRFMADLEPRHSNRADILLAGRFDVRHDQDTIMHIAKSFNVSPFVSRRQAEGWPHGCNELWFDTVEYCRENLEAKKWPRYKAILTCEADCVPLRRDWIERMHAAWDSRKSNEICAGALLQAPGEHMNGNMLVSAELADLHFFRKIGGAPPSQGWDYAIAGQLKRRGWLPTNEIVSYWGMKTCPPAVIEELQRRDVALLHGCKDSSGVSHVRRQLLGQRTLGYTIRPPRGPKVFIKSST